MRSSACALSSRPTAAFLAPTERRRCDESASKIDSLKPERITQVTLTNFSDLTVELAEHSEWDDLLMGYPQ